MTQPEKLPNPDESFRTMRTMYVGLGSGCVLISTIILYLVYMGMGGQVEDEAFVSMVTYGALLVAVAIPIVGHLLFRHYVNQAGDEAPLSNKLRAFTTANIVRWACLEGAVSAIMIAYMMTHSAMLLVAVVGVLGVFGLTAPTRERFSESFRLSMEEDDLLRSRP